MESLVCGPADLRSAAPRRARASASLVGLLAVELVFFGPLWALTVDGQACDGIVRELGGSISVTGGGEMLIGGSRSGHSVRSVPAHVEVETTSTIVFGYTLANGIHGVGSQDVSEQVFVRYVVGDTLPLMIAPHLGIARLGSAPGVQPSVVVVAALVTALSLSLIRKRLRLARATPGRQKRSRASSRPPELREERSTRSGRRSRS